MLNYNNSVIVIMDGGLGNKFNGLFQGIYFSNFYHKDLVVNNVRNRSTDFDLRLLFDFNFTYIENTITELDKKLEPSIPLYAHRKDIKYNRQVFLNQPIGKDSTFLLLNDRLNVTPEDLKSCYSRLKINSTIKDKVNRFVSDNNIDNNTLGLHIRASDFPSRDENIHYAYNFIKNNPTKRIFICTDEKAVEDFLKPNKNLVFYNKSHYTEKQNPAAGWNGQVIDSDNRRWNYNASRNEFSIIEAFIEMLILSKTNMHGNSRSTFLGWAKRFKESGLI